MKLFTRKSALLRLLTVTTLASTLAAPLVHGITIGRGNWIGTDKRGTAWYEEFQDWTKDDVRALDSNGDSYPLLDTVDMSRDLVAFYARAEGDRYNFRTDLFDLSSGAELLGLNIYVVIDCAPGGNEWLPDFTDTRTDRPWELVIAVYDSSSATVFNKAYQPVAGAWLGSYWNAQLDAVEFAINRSALVNAGWDGSSAISFQVFTTRDGTSLGSGELPGSDVTDAIGGFTRDIGDGSGRLSGGILSNARTGTAKYAAIAHANQSVATQQGTQNHIYNNRADINLHPGFIRALDSAEMLKVPMNLHISGTLLMSFLWAEQNPSEPGFPSRDGPTFLNRVKNFVTTGPGSLIGGVLAEHIMPYFEGDVNAKSIEQNSRLIQHLFGLSESQMKVMHVPERVIRSDTANSTVRPDGPLDGKTFEDIENSGFRATYLDEVTHLHHWFYPSEQGNAGWDDNNWGRWSGGQGNDDEPYHHKAHKINGVLTFMINDREDQSKFGNDDGGMARDTRYTLLRKAMDPDYAQIVIVFDDWEAYAGNSFASSTPNNNADQWHATLRWAANHPWIEIVNLKDAAGWAENDPRWVIDHGYTYNKPSQTYEWLKHASEQSYDTWYYGSSLEDSFYHRVPSVINGWAPAGMKKYGDMNSTGTLIRDSWDRIQQIATPHLKDLAEWSYSAMIYETAWHDENPPQWWPPIDKPWLAWADAYQSRNYQATFQRPEANAYADDFPKDYTSSWATRLHGHVRDMGVLKDASDWVADIKSGVQTTQTWAYAADIDDDRMDEYVLRNNRVYLCFERWGARLVKAFVFDPVLNGGDAVEVIGTPITNPPQESENEEADNNRCSVFKDRYSTGKGNTYIDLDFALTAPVRGTDAWTFTSSDGKVVKKVSLPSGLDAVTAAYALAPDVGTLYTRHGLGPNQFDLMLNGQKNLVSLGGTGYRGLRNTSGGEAFVVTLRNAKFIDTAISKAGWDHRELPLLEQFETFNSATSFSVAVAFSLGTAQNLASFQPPQSIQWMGNTFHWPVNGQINYGDQLWINTETFPIGAAVTSRVIFSTNAGATWVVSQMSKDGTIGQNDAWHVNMGTFAPGTTVRYAVFATDGLGSTLWDSRGGQDYQAVFNPGRAVQWIGNVAQWPLDGQLLAGQGLWVNIESWPAGAAIGARVVYSVNGGAWTSKALDRAGLQGNNDWWHLNIGAFNKGDVLRYAIEVRDGLGGTRWANNGGSDYRTTVK